MLYSRERVLKGFKPLFFTDNGLIFNKRDKIYLFTKDNKFKKIFTFKESFHVNILNKSNLFFRLHRSGVKSGVYFRGIYYFTYNKNIYRFDCRNKTISKEVTFQKGSGPLNITSVTNLKGFDDCLAFGEYFGNPTREPVHIISKRNKLKWNIVYTFNNGLINHIHNLVPDPYRNCVWILTGDFGDEASIWQATDNFRAVRKVASGEQIYRSCVAFPLEDGILYATDTQLERNSIRMLKKERNGNWKSETLFKINGSCIYACETKDYFVFSTTTEPDVKIKNRYLALLDNRLGPGIIKNYSDIIYCSKKNLKFNILTSNKKDFWPYILFQFGTIMFPAGKNETNKIYAYNVGSQQNDLSTEIWELN